ncbi:unnamed protein product, partial [marine sediment metagenome]
ALGFALIPRFVLIYIQKAGSGGPGDYVCLLDIGQGCGSNICGSVQIYTQERREQ